MSRSRKLKLVAGFLVLIALLGFTIERLVRDRLARGDVYPPFSSLRSDPLGTKALYDALSEIPGVETSRYMRPMDELQDQPPGTLLYLGDQSWSWEMNLPQRLFQSVEHWMASGGRMVITLSPQRHVNSWTEERRKRRLRMEEEREKEQEEERKGKKEEEKGKDRRKIEKPEDWDKEKEEWEREPQVKLISRWDVKVGRKALPEEESGEPKPVEVTAQGLDWPPLKWQSVQYFDLSPTSEWKTIATRDGNLPVVIERKFGEGSLVLVSDTYALTNEGLWLDRNSPFLSWLISGKKRVYFDETHFGVEDQPGIATLARRYGLFGGVYMLGLLAILFIWRNASSLAPAYPESQAGSSLGEESSLGMINLLKRSVAPAEVIPLCTEEWERTGDARVKRHLNEVKEVWPQEVRQEKRPNPIRAYHRIQQLLRIKQGQKR